MGRRSREHRERREIRITDAAKDSGESQTGQQRADQLEEELKRLLEGDAVFGTSENCPAEVRETNLEDILAFESVDSGTSLFDGLQRNGLDLPHPEKLDERQSAEKAREVLMALAGLRVFLIGFEGMTAREFYSTLWNQTLWEGCYVEKRIPGASTIIDVSHSLPRSEILRFVEELSKAGSVH